VHELSIAQAVVRTVLAAVGDAQVEAVELTVGALSGVVPTALEFAWDVATAGTALQGAALVVTSVPTTVWCRRCAAVVQPELGFACPTCGDLSGDLRSGRELEVTSARLREDSDEAVRA
jgi:hydrogenase nickel incorporation protein HypA/HybF